MKNTVFTICLLLAITMLSSFNSNNEIANYANPQQSNNPFQKVVGNWKGTYKLFNSLNQQISSDAITLQIDQLQDIISVEFTNDKLEKTLFQHKKINFNYSEDLKEFYVAEKNNLIMDNTTEYNTIKKAEKGRLIINETNNQLAITIKYSFIHVEKGKDPTALTYELIMELSPI